MYLNTGNSIREPQDCTGNEPIPNIHIGGSGQDTKNYNYMLFGLNILIMYLGHHPGTEIEGDDTITIPESITKNTNQASIIKL